MAKATEQTESKQSWFRDYFRANPGVLETRSNQEVISSWKDDHPGEEFGRSEQTAMSNVKGSERKRLHMGRRNKKRKSAEDGVAPSPPKAPKVRVRSGDLETLEVSIDRCLSLARHLEEQDEEMGKVVQFLRDARNGVVWILGK